MQEKSFEPFYSFKSVFLTNFMFIYGILLILTLVILLYFHNILLAFLEGMIFVIGMIGFARGLIRKVVFKRSTFTVEYYLWPPRTVSYADVVDLGYYTIKTRKGTIRPSGMSNWYELMVRFRELVEDNTIQSIQLKNKEVIEETIDRKSWTRSFFLALPLWMLLIFLWDRYGHPFGSMGLALTGTFIWLLVYFISRWVVRKASHRSLFGKD